MTQTTRTTVTAGMIQAAADALAQAILSGNLDANARLIDRAVGMWQHATDSVRTQARLLAQEA